MGVLHHLLLAVVAAASGPGPEAAGGSPAQAPSGALAEVASPPVAWPPDPAQASSSGAAVLHAEAPAYRSNVWVPLLETGVTVVGLNLLDRQVLGYQWAQTDLETATRNLGTWRFDGDSFQLNNLMHPYTGSIYYGAARSMGLGMWWSLGVTSLGSALWEIGGETEPASINDQIMTSVGGSFLGEVLYRCAVLVLTGGDGAPGFWREGAALLVSPPTGANRLMFGDRYRTFDFDRRPAVYLEASAGVGLERAPRPGGGSGATVALLDLHLAHGLPGEGGWPVRHPFDHFDLQLGLRSGERESLVAALFIRGMLAASRIQGSWSGVWGLAGLYDYSTPGAFHVSTAALGVSATGQLGARGGVALQGTALLGGGFGSAGAAVAPAGSAGDHRGPAAQAVLESRLLLGDRAAIDAGLRQYLVAGSAASNGLEAQHQLSLSGRLRVLGPHAVGVGWMSAWRWSRSPGVPDARQRSSELSFFYTLSTDRALGARPRRGRSDRRARCPAPPGRRAPDGLPAAPFPGV